MTEVLGRLGDAMIDHDEALYPAPASAAAPTTAEPECALPDVEGALARHEVQIRRLQQAVIEMANAAEGAAIDPPARLRGEDVSGLHERIAQLESRLVEQDRMIRHTLTMLIEWIEAGGTHSQAL